MAPLVDSCHIKHASLRNSLPIYLHTYVWPFVIIWPIFFRYYLSNELYDQFIGGQEWTFFWSGSIITAQSLVWLSTHWNVNLRSLFTTISTKDIRDAQLIKVVPVSNAGASDICIIIRDNVGGEQNISFLFQKRRFQYDFEKKAFSPLVHTVDTEPKPFLEHFQNSRGLTTEAEINRIKRYYGDNTFDIPIPSFGELFKEHAVAPFFVFQVFCVGLWMLDEYWYYSIFTLFMLVVFESTVVWQRQRTLNEFRGMSIKPYDIWVFRKNEWEEIQSNKLLPGDLVSVGRTKEDSGVACDMLLVQGSAIVNEAMLSGESTPLLKDSILLRPSNARLEPLGLDKNSFLYGGTKVLQITHSNNEEESTLLSGTPRPPDNGAMAIVTRTGFETSQGSLVRTMIYSTERVSANNAEALFFILFLLIFAIAASWYVWDEGVKKDRKRSKLMLDCILIITSVVPPELPMELSLAVNTSLAALSRYAIYCTEPFRIPFAGRVDVACFDKTGTLTGEDLVVEGIAGHELSKAGIDQQSRFNYECSHITPIAQACTETIIVLATAHAVVRLDEGDIVGDPMEKATLNSIGWTIGNNDTLSSQKSATTDSSNSLNSVQIRRRFQFSSALKRQSSVAIITIQKPGSNKKIRSTFLGVKGAPETIVKMLIKIPANYEETYKYFTRKGSRVLALAFKYLATDSELSIRKINELKREEAESDLHFAGFLVLHCPLKEDAKKSVRMLNESSHRVVMITGDSPLTACHVAYEVDIIDRKVLILDAPEHDDVEEKLVWKDVNDTISIPVDPNRPIDSDIIANNDLCITGYALAKFHDKKILETIYRNSWVYARVSPKQKEEILMGLKSLGYYTLMAGDGTNDVGALKQAHIGVALLNGSQDDLNKIAEHFRITKLKELYEKQCQILKRFDRPNPSVPIAIAHLYPPGPLNPYYSEAVAREAEKKNLKPTLGNTTITSDSKNTVLNNTNNKQSLVNLGRPKAQDMLSQNNSLADRLTQSMMDQDLDDEPPTIKLGDASVAAPFTSKLSNVIAIPNIIRQGRCTLVATIQMYKILALNCLISAYSLSVLYLEGIKFGDGQVTISGMLMSVCFLSISRAKSVEGLSKERPQPNIFNFYIIGSILGQFAIHITTLIYIARFCDRLAPREHDVIDLEGDFSPSLLNSAVYLLQLIQQISTFAINYQGRPFRESLSENRGMYWGIIGVSCIAFSCSTEFIPEINEKMRLVPFSTEFKLTMTATMIVDYIGCWIVEKILKLVFSDYKPKDIAVRRPDQLEREKKSREADHLRLINSEEKISQEAEKELEKKLAERKKTRRRDQRFESETLDFLPSHQETSTRVAAVQVTKTALRLRYLIEECIPYEIDVGKITASHSRIITKDVIKAASEAGGDHFRACVVYCLLVNKRWFQKQARSELCDADLLNVRATACEVIAKNIIETEEDQEYLLKEVLLKRYSVLIDGKLTMPANVIERAVDLHALRVTGSSGYQKCVNYLWRGWLVQDVKDPSEFVSYENKANTSYWAHVDPDRMRVPVYQNATQVIFSIVYLGLYTGVINTVNHSGDLDMVEIILYIFTFGFLSDELSKIWKVGYLYIGFWNVFNLTLYTLLMTSLTTRLIAFTHPIGKDHMREKLNELSYNFLAFSAPMFWMRLLLYLDSIRFFGVMLVILKVMMSESLIFFALLTVIIIGFLQAFIGLDAADNHTNSTYFILQAMTNAVMQSPEFTGFDNFAPPFGAVLYYIFTFLITVVLLNILIALFNSAYQDVTDNAIDEYLALFSHKTMQFVRAPDENVFIAPLNLVEIVVLILPFEWWLPCRIYARLNDIIMTILYLPLLLVTAWFETRSSNKVTANRSRGEEDDDMPEEWEQAIGESNFSVDGWDKKVFSVKPNIEEDQSTVEVTKLRREVEELRDLLKLLIQKTS